MTIQLTELMNAYDKLTPLAKETGYLSSDFSKLATIFEDKKRNPDVSIMVYGVYNAGKSTLINALTGKEVAETGDIPLTDKVTAYDCGAFKILDTPGIDAPIQHENITKEQLLKADAIVFVVNPLGVVEEKKTLKVLLDLFEKGKKVFLVFNEKERLEEATYIRLKDQTRNVLQDMASERGLHGILNDIPISKLNAKTALKAKLEDKSNLLQVSGYPAFEKSLNDFINSVSKSSVNERLDIELKAFLETFSKEIANNSQEAIVKKYDKFILNINNEKIKTRDQVFDFVEKDRKELHDQVKSWLRSENKNIQQDLTNWINDRSNIILIKFNSIFEKVSLELKNDIEELETQIPQVKVNPNTPNVSNIDVSIPVASETALEKASGIAIDKEQLKTLSTNLATQVKTEHVIAGLNLLKQKLPSLMKGIGEKTIEKWAGQVVGKAIPIAGAAITIGMAVHDMFSEDEETTRLKREQEAHRKARERIEEQINDTVRDISTQFANSLTLSLNSAVDEFFNKLVEELKSLSSNFSDNDKKNSEYLERLNLIKQELNS